MSSSLIIQIVAPCIAAIAAIIAATISVRSSRTLQRSVDRQHEIDFRRQQLNELYGPIHMKQSTSVSLRKLLPWTEPDGSKWRLVDHISEVKNSNDPTTLNAVQEILRINDEIMNALISKSSLYVAFPPPMALSHYIAHVKLLSLAWGQGRDQDPENRLPFPDDFDRVIEEAVLQIRKRLAELGALPVDTTVAPITAHILAPRVQADHKL